MPRGPRLVHKNAILNVTSRGNNKKIIFRKKKDYLYFKILLLKYKRIYKIKIYRYCLMKNHVHLLVKIIDPSSLARAMKSIQLAYFHHFRKRYGYVGRFWQGRFHSKIVGDDKYFLTACLYIEANPAKSKLVKDPLEYPWSSYATYVSDKKDLLLDYDPRYLGLSKVAKERQALYKKMMIDYLKKVENDAT